MSQPIVPVDICNLALDRIGQAPIASILAPNNPSEDVCGRWYDQTRRELLRDYIFNFARLPVVLTIDESAPAIPEYTNVYRLPNDFIRLLTIGDRLLFGGNIPTSFFTMSDGYLYCDELTDQGLDEDDETIPGLQIEYIYDAVTVTKFDPAFLRCLYLQLAANIAYKFTLKSSLKDSLDKELASALMKAAAISGQEKPPRRVQRSRIRDVRRSGGIYRNNTVIGGG